MTIVRLPIQSGAMTDTAPPGTASLSPAPRPNLVRRETDQILAYYQSEHAGRSIDYASAHPDFESEPQYPAPTSHLPPLPTHAHSRQYSSFSSASDYSSAYSESDSDFIVPPPASTVSPQREVRAPAPRTSAGTASDVQSTSGHGNSTRHSRRPSVPSEGGADRRRLAIVEMDIPPVAPLSVARKRSKALLDGKSSLDPPSSSIPAGTLFSRRGLSIGGLALVAPPDAAPSSYTDLTPPSTAPISTGSGSTVHAPPSAFPTHTRSASEAVDTSGSRSRLHHKSSRDVGIVGLSPSSTTSEGLSPTSPTSEEYHVYAQTEGLGVPMFQTPAKSRSPSPGGATPDLSDTSSASAFRSPHQRLLSTPILGMDDGIITPGIGEGKDIQQPVVGPVIVGLSPELLHGTQGATNFSTAARTTNPGSPTALRSSASPSYHPPSHFLHYHPGLHATAGPLPPPPRSIFDRGDTTAPPRPPRLHTPLPHGARRDIDAIKEALQLPQSVSAKLAARTPPESQAEKEKRLTKEASPSPRPDSSRETRSQESTYSQESIFEPSVKLVPPKSVHRREGAFPPSKILSGVPAKQTDQEPVSPRSENRPLVVIEQDEHEEKQKEPERRPGLELHRDSSWVSLGDAAKRLSSPNGKAGALPTVSVYRSSSNVSEESSSSSVSRLPSLPPKSIRGGSDDEKQGASLAPSSFKALTNLKRFSSLPRTPSRSSKSSKRSTSPDPRRSFSPPASSVHAAESPPRRRPIPIPQYIHPWPPAMDVADVLVLRSARERTMAYAMKINELAMFDCGLREWLAGQARGPVSHPRTQSQRTAHHESLHPVPLELGGLSPNAPRHVSRGSIASEMTFPIRPDAYTATDLSVRTIDLPTTQPLVVLPYPSLAHSQPQRAPARSSTLILSPTKTLQIPLPLPGAKGAGTGFFASLGRKTSIRKDKGLPTPPSQLSSPSKVLTKQRPQAIAASQSNPSPPRPSAKPAPPTVPGGPRAAPGRIQRAQTVGPGSAPPATELSPPETSQSPPTSNNNIDKRQSVRASRRPSLFARARPGHGSVVSSSNKEKDPVAFGESLKQLVALVPDADPDVLATYLRQAGGEEVVAIGLYLDAERSGKLRRD